MKCRSCRSELKQNFLDLGSTPVSNGYISVEDLNKAEKNYPLIVKVCESCWLVQTIDYVSTNELFNDNYAYFSGISDKWKKHVAIFTKEIITRLKLGSNSFVVEIASNDGSLLENFKKLGIPCLGVEPTASTASAAEEKGIPVLREFFSAEIGKKLAMKNQKADLVIGNNVYAHVPDINDFTLGIKNILKPNGVLILEFPHLVELIKNSQFDTVYHEHFSYLSLISVQQVFKRSGLKIFDVEKIKTHGGSLRIFGCHKTSNWQTTTNVEDILNEEIQKGLKNLTTYENFQSKANKIRDELLTFLNVQKTLGKVVVGYGAAAKGNTLLNYAGIRSDLVKYVVDAAPSKQNKFMPGSHIPIVSPNELITSKIDYILVLPWNIATEIKEQNQILVDKGVTFIAAIPKIRIL